MRKNNINKYFWIILLIIGIAGCGQKEPPVSYPELDISNKSPVEILEKTRINAEKILSLQGIFSLKIEIDGQKDSFDAAFLYENPDTLRMDIYGFWGKLLLISTLQEDSIQVYLPTERSLIQGHVNSTELKNLIGLDVDFKNILWVFNQFLPFLQIELQDPIVLEIDEYQYRVTVDKYGKKAIFWIDPMHYYINKAEIWDIFEKSYTLFTFEEHKKQDGIFLANRIKISRPLMSEKLNLDYDELEVNPNLKKEDFIFKIPENVQYFRVK